MTTNPLDAAIMAAIVAAEDSSILTVAGLAALAVQTAEPILCAAWKPANSGDTPGSLVPGEGDAPRGIEAAVAAGLDASVIAYDDYVTEASGDLPEPHHLGPWRRDTLRAAPAWQAAITAAVRAAVPHIVAGHDGPDGHCVCYHLVRKQLDELQAKVDRTTWPPRTQSTTRPEAIEAARAIEEVGG